MDLGLLFRTRWLGPQARFVALSLTATIAGCSDDPTPKTASDDVVTLPHTDPKNQAIGNCWIYATGSWVEALHASATGESLDLSESYWSYWHWYLQLLWSANDTPTKYTGIKEIRTGGTFTESAHILKYFGAMLEKDFIPEDANAIRSGRQSSALAAINRSLRDGALKEVAARKNRDLLRKELDAAWRLTPEASARLDAAFGRNLEKTPDGSSADFHKVISSKKLMVSAVNPTTKAKETVALVETLPSADGRSDGRYAWREVFYPKEAGERRAFLARAQRAIHDGLPPLVRFTVDFAAMRGATFADVPASPGNQGGHMVVMSDYEIENVPGFGTLRAGEDATPEQLEAALAPEAKLSFIRVKNSWGPTSTFQELSVSGHYDLYLKYLDGPMKYCLQPDGSTDRNNCRDETPFVSLVFPAGY
jgi:hypothetical protein